MRPPLGCGRSGGWSDADRSDRAGPRRDPAVPRARRSDATAHARHRPGHPCATAAADVSRPMHAVGLGALRTGTAPDGRCSDPDARKNKGEAGAAAQRAGRSRRMPRGLQSLDVPPHPYPSVPCRVRSLRGSRASVGPRHANPSDSRHLLGLGQALLRRGKQICWCRSIVGRSPHQDRAKSRLCRRPKPLPFPAGAPALCSQWPGLRPLLQTTVYGRLIDL